MSVSQTNKESPAQRLERLEATVNELQDQIATLKKNQGNERYIIADVARGIETLCRAVREPNASVRNSIVEEALVHFDPDRTRGEIQQRYE